MNLLAYRIDQITLQGKRYRGNHRYKRFGYAKKMAERREQMDPNKGTKYEVVPLLYRRYFLHYSYDKNEWTIGGEELREHEFNCQVYAECEIDALDEAKKRLKILLEVVTEKESSNEAR